MMTTTHKGVMVGGWLLLLLCSTVLSQIDSSLNQSWEQWKTKHKKNYQNQRDEMNRRGVWEKNLLQIDLHNQQQSGGVHTYTKAMNHLGDLTKEEFLQYYATMKPPSVLSSVRASDMPQYDVPDALDWRTKGAVTSVKDQGPCGSCWAFSAVGALEGLMFRTTGKLVDLSPQNLVDCAGAYGNDGCNGGLMAPAFQYVVDNGGLDSERSYPYEAVDGNCRYNVKHKAANCSTIGIIGQNEEYLKIATAVIGPISVGIHSDDWQFYSSGVFNNPNCSKALDHGVLVVGYGNHDNQDYWLVKNSWGTSWGENGYIRLARNADQMCGISTYAVFPYPSQPFS